MEKIPLHEIKHCLGVLESIAYDKYGNRDWFAGYTEELLTRIINELPATKQIKAMVEIQDATNNVLSQ